MAERLDNLKGEYIARSCCLITGKDNDEIRLCLVTRDGFANIHITETMLALIIEDGSKHIANIIRANAAEK